MKHCVQHIKSTPTFGFKRLNEEIKTKVTKVTKVGLGLKGYRTTWSHLC